MIEANQEHFAPEGDNIFLDKSSNSIRTTGEKNTKRLAEISKKIENVEFLIKIEEKNRKQVSDNFNRHYTKLTKFISNYETDITQSLGSLKTKEKSICDVQKNKFSLFKDEIKKYDKILKELENRQKDLKVLASEASDVSEDYYNQKSMLYEDLLSYKNEIKKLRVLNDNITLSLKVIEDSYPKEFDFLLNDIISEKEVRVMIVQNKQMAKDIEKLEFEIQKESIIKSQREEEVENLLKSTGRIENTLEINKNTNYLVRLEHMIADTITDTLTLDFLKAKIQHYFIRKHFDLENEVNVVHIKTLQEKKMQLRKELLDQKSEKMVKKNNAEMFINEMNSLLSDNLNIDKKKITKERDDKKEELNNIMHEIQTIDLKIKKREGLINKHLMLIKQNITKTPRESYHENNTALILENEFFVKIRDDIINEIEKNEIWSLDEKQRHKNLVEVYFKEIVKRDQSIIENLAKKRNTENAIAEKTKQIEEGEKYLNKCKRGIITKRNTIKNNGVVEKLLLDKMNKANKEMNNNLNSLSENEFEKYMNLNDNVVKNMTRLHGTNNVNNIFKVKKQKFIEKVIQDHCFKRNKIGQYIKSMYFHEEVIRSYLKTISETEEEFNTANENYLEKYHYKVRKINENKLVEDSKKEIKEKIEEILATQLHQIELEKKDLQIEFNQNYDLEKFQYLERKLHELRSEKTKLESDFLQSQINSDGKEQRLFNEENSLINHLRNISKKENLLLNQSQEEGKTNLYFEDFKILNTDTSHTQLIRKKTVNQEKINCLVEGLNIYKKFYNLISTTGKFKPFDPSDSYIQPEKYGYVIRNFKINTTEKTLEIRNQKVKVLEQKIFLTDVKGIMLDTHSKNLVKKFRVDHKHATVNSHILFMLIYEGGSLELMAPSYNSFHMLQSAFNEIEKHKSNLKFEL